MKPVMPVPEMTTRDIERFWSKVNKDGPVPAHRSGLGPCWLWTASTMAKRGGYGRFGLRNKIYRAHIVSYTLANGPVPNGKVLDHLCRTPPCVNPAHLEPVTSRENILRGQGFGAVNAAKTHCHAGHEFTPENTYTGTATTGVLRQCRTCGRENARRYFRDRKSGKQATDLACQPLQLSGQADPS